MKIERIIIRKLRALRERDDLLVGPSGQVFSAACLRGLNGSGKTSYLEAIAELWQWFRRCTKQRAYAKPESKLLPDAELVAVLFVDLPGPKPRMWLAFGGADAVSTLPPGPENPCTIKGSRVLWDKAVLDFWATTVSTYFFPPSRKHNRPPVRMPFFAVV